MQSVPKRLSREKLAVVSAEMAEAIREAIIDEDLEGLYELIDGVGLRDAEVAEYLRAFVEESAYEALEDLFDVRGR